VDSFQTALDHYRHGRLAEAEAACERLKDSDRDRLAALTLLAELRLDSGRVEAAIADLRELAHRAPRDAANLRRLGGALLSIARPAEAVVVLRQAVAVDPANVRGLNNLGLALLRLDRAPEAADCFRRTLELDPEYMIGELNLGLALEGLGQPEAALPHYDRVVALRPAEALAWARRGALLWRLGRPAAALPSLETAISLRSDDLASLTLRAGVLLALERPREALEAAETALTHDPAGIEALQYRAAALCQLFRAEEALPCLERALELAPTNDEVWCNRAVVHQHLGDAQAARRCYAEALRLAPASIAARAGLLASAIAPVPSSLEEVVRGREDLARGLTAFEDWLHEHPLDDAQAWTLAQLPFFYLSYRESSNLSLLHRFRARTSRELGLRVPAAPMRAAARASESSRHRLGIVSAHVHEHSVFRALTRGWLQRLDRDAFEISIFHLGTRHDAATDFARGAADRFEAEPRGLPDWARTLREANLDALIYPEVGIHRGTLALAGLRLAPRQFVAWGHPETTGLPTIDAFLSADAFEPAGAQAHYSERLVRLPHLGVYVEPQPVEAAKPDLEGLGIRTDAPWFVCAGTPFKYDPGHDAVWVEIARRVPRSTFVFFEYERPAMSRLLRRRLAARFAAAGLESERRLLFIPWQPQAEFVALLRHASVYLDTLGFSGFNTLLQAVEAGLPCVAYEGRYLRGRLGSGILRRIGLDELVAGDAAAYVEIATRLATDRAHRAAVADRLRRAVMRAYGDASAVRALECELLG
jgi:predicted O-linked N-acetylglucosamine transferase (SPINDLY family)